MNVTIPASRPTKEEAAKMLGIHIYDVALPQGWLDEFVKKTGMDYHKALRSFVWSYDVCTSFGCPRPLTLDAHVQLRSYDQISGTSYTDENSEVLMIEVHL
jgi:hypothetical protein